MPARVERVTVHCLFCSNPFDALPSRIAAGTAKYCSIACTRNASKRQVECLCETCHVIFTLPQSRIGNKGQGRFCSRKCRPYQTPRESDEQRFWKYAVRGQTANDCWSWKGSTFGFGYGQVRLNSLKRQIEAHRMSYMLHKGEIPDGLCVMHTCDNPPCTNPLHLRLGTKRDNSEDMVSKARSARGSKHVHAKLTEVDVLEIRDAYHKARLPELAEKYGVSPATIEDAVHRRTWKHI